MFLRYQTSSHNPLDIINGKFLDSSGAYDSQNNLACLDRDNYSPSLSDDPKHDLVDLRRQIVYLQVFNARAPTFTKKRTNAKTIAFGLCC